jgi:thioredoxin-like negative regulator of GroEL
MFGPTVDKFVAETGIPVQKIDVDSNRELTSQNNVSSVPTLIFEKEGQIVFRHTGVMSYSQLTATIERL